MRAELPQAVRLQDSEQLHDAAEEEDVRHHLPYYLPQRHHPPGVFRLHGRFYIFVECISLLKVQRRKIITLKTF